MITNNQTKCGIIYEKFAVRESGDEGIINYEWPYVNGNVKVRDPCHITEKYRGSAYRDRLN